MGGKLLAGAGRLAGTVAAGAAVYEGVTGGYYESKRAQGNNKVVSGLATLGGGALDVLSQPLKWTRITEKTFGEAYREKYKNEIASGGGKTNADGTPKSAPPAMGERFSANMRDVIKSMAMSMGPKASYTAIGEVGKQAQLAAINQDPIEAKLLRRMIQSLGEFQKSFESEAQKQGTQEQISRRPEVRRS